MILSEEANYEIEQFLISLGNEEIPLQSLGKSIKSELKNLPISNDLHKDLTRVFNDFRRRLREVADGREITPELLVEQYHLFAKEIIDTREVSGEDNSKEVPEILIKEMFPDDWEILAKHGIEKPIEGVIFRGGTSRTGTRENLGIPNNLLDPVSDVDAYTGPGVDRQKLADFYNSGVNGFIGMPDLDESVKEYHFTDGADITMNQTLLGPDHNYYTEAAANDIRDGRIVSVKGRKDSIYGQDELSTEPLLFNVHHIYRLMSYYIRGKGDIVRFPDANMTPSGINALKGSLEKYFLIILLKIFKKGAPKNSSEIHRLSISLKRMKSMMDLFQIETMSGMLNVDHSAEKGIKELIEQNPDFVFRLTEMDEMGEVMWLTKKIIRTVLRGYTSNEELITSIRIELNSNSKSSEGDSPGYIDYEKKEHSDFNHIELSDMIETILIKIYFQKESTKKGNDELLLGWRKFSNVIR